MMHFKVYLLLCTNLFFYQYSNAFNITYMLNQYPSFSTFNQYLTETNLASEINSHKKITVFAVPNNAISRLFGKLQDVLRNLLKAHVVTDYYDVEKLTNLANHTGQLITLDQQGFLKPTIFKNNIFVGSAATQGSALGALLVSLVTFEPCNMSVYRISTAIVPVGVSGSDSRVVQPPINSPKMPPVQPPVYIPVNEPPLAPVLGPVYAKSLPPYLKPPITSPSESPADAPEYSRESPPKPVNTPTVAGTPAASACRDTSDLSIGLYAVLCISTATIYLIAQT